MRVFLLIIAILIVFTGWVKPLDFKMSHFLPMEESSMAQDESHLSQILGTVCGGIICEGVVFAQNTVNNCIMHCVQNALGFVEKNITLFLSPIIHLDTAVFLALAYVLIQTLCAYVLIRYLLYAYTFFHLRFVTSTILRN